MDAQNIELSIIIPVGLGDHTFHSLIRDLESIPQSWEIIIVFASDDADVREVEFSEITDKNIKTIHADRGRARQMNAGAKVATGLYVWFLHADSRLPAQSIDRAKALVLKRLNEVYYFDLSFLNDGPRLMLLNSIGANLRSRLFGLPFGDQGYLLQRRLFMHLGMYNEQVVYGEDHHLVWCIKKSSARLIAAKAQIFTSARKYRSNGWLRTTCWHISLSLIQCGMNLTKLRAR